MPTDAVPSFAAPPNAELVDFQLPERLRESVYYKLEQEPGSPMLWLRSDRSAGPAADAKRALHEVLEDTPADALSLFSINATALASLPAAVADVPLPGGGFGFIAQARVEPLRVLEIGGSGVGDIEKATAKAVAASLRRSSGPPGAAPAGQRWHRIGDLTFLAPVGLKVKQARFSGKGELISVTLSPSCAKQAEAFLAPEGTHPEDARSIAVGEPRDERQTVGGVSTRLMWATVAGPGYRKLLRLAASRVGIDCLLVMYEGSMDEGAGVLPDEEWLSIAAAARGAAEAP